MDGLDRCLATKYLKKDHFWRGCGNEIIFKQQKTKCAAQSCEVSLTVWPRGMSLGSIKRIVGKQKLVLFI